jgi:hypothetical protein
MHNAITSIAARIKRKLAILELDLLDEMERFAFLSDQSKSSIASQNQRNARNH